MFSVLPARALCCILWCLIDSTLALRNGWSEDVIGWFRNSSGGAPAYRVVQLKSVLKNIEKKTTTLWIIIHGHFIKKIIDSLINRF